VAQIVIFSQINTKHINTVWAERTVVEYLTVSLYSGYWVLRD